MMYGLRGWLIKLKEYVVFTLEQIAEDLAAGSRAKAEAEAQRLENARREAEMFEAIDKYKSGVRTRRMEIEDEEG